MTVVEKNIEDLKPYERNARKNDKAVETLVRSISQFGFRVPILIEKDGTIVAGHTRYKACKKLNKRQVPCIVVDDLTEEQIKAFRLADNKVAEVADWDFSLLDDELENILDIDMSEFGFEKKEDKDNERVRTNKAYNLGYLSDIECTDDFYQMPIIQCDNYIPSDLIGFNYAKTAKNKDAGVHFYIDDYQFERLWNYPEKYIDTLWDYECVLSPDFSLYRDMPMCMKIWNVYRSRFIGAFYQRNGIRVIPTISWAEKETFDFAFLGIPKGSIVSISTVGVKNDDEALAMWCAGVDEMILRIQPQSILVYGGAVDYNFADIDVRYYENHVLKDWKER